MGCRAQLRSGLLDCTTVKTMFRTKMFDTNIEAIESLSHEKCSKQNQGMRMAEVG